MFLLFQVVSFVGAVYLRHKHFPSTTSEICQTLITTTVKHSSEVKYTKR